MARFLLTLALALAALVGGVGCDGGARGRASLALRAWTLAVPGRTEVRVALPAHLEAEIPDAPLTYVLRTEAPLPPELRDRDLVFTAARLPAAVRLEVGALAVEAPALGGEDGRRGAPAHAWRIPREAVAQAVRDGALPLALFVRHEGPMSAWIEAEPRLSADPEGDPRDAFVVRANGVASAVALGTLWPIGLMHLVIFGLDRRRPQNGWFALQALTAAAYPLFEIGWSARVFGPVDTVALALTQATAPIAGVCFTHAAFAIGRPPRAFSALAAALAALAIAVAPFPFLQARTLAPFVVGAIVLTVGYQIVTLARLAGRRPRPANVIVLLVAWSVVAATVAFDGATFLGGAAPLAGLRAGSWGLVVVAACQSIVLSRDHVRSLARADELNAELAARVAQLEDRQGEIHLLHDELRRKIAERSQQIVEALARGGEPPGDLEPGRVVAARWRVVRVAGAGGMGRVYEVERLADGRRFAMKVLARVAHRAGLARLAREAELAARVVHPNVVAVGDLDVSEEGWLYLVYEFVDGETLEDSRGRFGDVDWALPLVGQVARGLAALHASAVVHRDLKPANVLVARGTGVAKITDFGIASLSAAPDAADPSLTRTGVILGTPTYMAPEVVRGAREAGPAADVFALGVLAYEMLSGARPFAEPPAVAALRGGSLPAATAPLRAAAPAVPGAIAEIVDRAIATDPAARPTAEALATALAACTARAA